MSVIQIGDQSFDLSVLDITLTNMTASNQNIFLGLNKFWYYQINENNLLILKNTILNNQLVDTYTIAYDITRQFNLKFINRNYSGIELNIQQAINNLGSSITITDLSQINAFLYSKDGSYRRLAQMIGTDWDAGEIAVYAGSSNQLQSSNKLISDFVDRTTNQTINGVKTFNSNIVLNNVDSITSATNTLLVFNPNTFKIEKSLFPLSHVADTTQIDTIYNYMTNNILNNMVDLSSNQTITGTKIFQNLVLDPITAITSSSNTLLVYNPNTFKIEKSLFPLSHVADTTQIDTIYNYMTNNILNNMVDLSSSQTITGTKIFQNLVLDPITSITSSSNTLLVYNPTTKKIEKSAFPISSVADQSQITTISNNLSSNYVDLSSAQTITGAKSFSGSVKLPTLTNDTTTTNTALFIKSDGTIATNTSLTPSSIQTTAAADAAYLKKTDAATTYLTQSNASSTYLSLVNAANTYLNQTLAASTYLTITNAANTYLTIANAASTYLTSATAASVYQTITNMANYLTTATASTTYQTIANMTSYLTTSSASSTYLSITNGVDKSSAQTITGNKTFSGTTTFSKKVDPLWHANQTLYIGNGGSAWNGYVQYTYNLTSTTAYLYWNNNIICVPSFSFGTGGTAPLNIPCPTTGTITLYNASTTATTTTCSSNGINIVNLSAKYLFYTITSNVYSQSNFTLIIGSTTLQSLIENGTIDNTWILIAEGNVNNSLMFYPLKRSIAVDSTAYDNGDVFPLSRALPSMVQSVSSAISCANATETAIGGSSNLSITLNGLTYLNYNGTTKTFTLPNINLMLSITFSVAFDPSATGIRLARIYNSTSTFGGSGYLAEVRQQGSSTTGTNYLSGSITIQFNKNDSFKIVAYQSSGGALNVLTDSKISITIL